MGTGLPTRCLWGAVGCFDERRGVVEMGGSTKTGATALKMGLRRKPGIAEVPKPHGIIPVTNLVEGERGGTQQRDF